MGPTMYPIPAHKISTALDKIPPVYCINRSANKQHHLYLYNSHTMVWCMQVWNLSIQWKRTEMVLEHPTRIPRNVNTQYPIILGIRNVNLPHHLKIRTGDSYTSLCGQFRHPGIYVQVIIWPHQIGNPPNSCKIFGLDPHHHWIITAHPTHQR